MYLQPRVKVIVYETAGTSLAAKPYVEGYLNILPAPKYVSVGCGVDGDVGVSLKIFNQSLIDHHGDWTGPYRELYRRNL